MRFLVIEDHTDTRELIVDVLADAGYDVLSASNGTFGLNLFKESPVDMVITDLFMPDTDGLQVVMALRSAVPRSRSSPCPAEECTATPLP